MGRSFFMSPYKKKPKMQKHPPLVLISGIMCNEKLWSSQVEHFSSKDVSVIIPDVLQEKTVEQLAFEILSSIDGQINIVGFSSGGYIAQEIIRISPDKVNKVMLISTSGGEYTKNQQLKRESFLNGNNNYSKGMSGLSSFASKLLSSYSSLGDKHIFDSINNMLNSIDSRIFYQQMRIIYEYNKSPPDLSNITMPALIVCSDNDPFISSEAYIELVNKIPTAELKIIEGSGHMLPFSASDDVNEAIESFFGYPKFNYEAQCRRV